MSTFPQLLKNGLLALFFTLIFVANSQAQASIQPPDEMIKNATDKMLRSINDNRAQIKKTPDKLKSLVEENLIPHIDFITSSKLVLGKYWRRADINQKKQFIRQFRLMLLRFYSSALAEYLDGRNKDLDLNLIKYFPLKIKEGEKSLTVRGQIKVDSGQPIPLRYRLHITKKGWKVFDVTVEGVSMITTYKNNFASQLKTDGIDALIASLVEKNKNLLAKNDKK